MGPAPGDQLVSDGLCCRAELDGSDSASSQIACSASMPAEREADSEEVAGMLKALVLGHGGQRPGKAGAVTSSAANGAPDWDYGR